MFSEVGVIARKNFHQKSRDWIFNSNTLDGKQFRLQIRVGNQNMGEMLDN